MPVSQADKFCQKVAALPDMPNTAAKIGAWLVSMSASLRGPVHTSYREISTATGCHYRSVVSSVEWLVSAGIVRVGKGEWAGGTHHKKVIEVAL